MKINDIITTTIRKYCDNVHKSTTTIAKMKIIKIFAVDDDDLPDFITARMHHMVITKSRKQWLRDMQLVQYFPNAKPYPLSL